MRLFFPDRPTGRSFPSTETSIMVKIRLSRAGAKGRPFYHIVVADERCARDGRNIERLGYYNPVASGKDVRLELDTEKAAAWIQKGAQPTEKVRQLIKQAGKQNAAA
jgi:small subunit ribosomal protein S16